MSFLDCFKFFKSYPAEEPFTLSKSKVVNAFLKSKEFLAINSIIEQAYISDYNTKRYGVLGYSRVYLSSGTTSYSCNSGVGNATKQDTWKI